MAETIELVCPHCSARNRIPLERLNDAPRCGKCKQGLFTGKAVSLNTEQFNRQINHSQIPIVVDFWAPWCGPCKMMAPFYEQAAAQLEPKVRLVKVNTEIEQQLGARFDIRSIPTLAVFQNGKETARQAGAMELGGLLSWIKANAGI